MANRRFEVHEIRNVIVRMRLGDSDREIQKVGLMGRAKAACLRKDALERDWLDIEKTLPSNEVIAAELAHRGMTRETKSHVREHVDEIRAWVASGVTAMAIHQTLIRRYGFTGAYNSVKRFVRQCRENKGPRSMVLDFEPGEAAQVDFGAGPLMTDAATGEVFKTWFFVMTLAFSRHQYLEFVRDQKVSTWLGCHRRAFEFFGGLPRRVIIDNPKCAITKACYHDPVVQRSYAEFAEGYGFLISPCPVREPKKKGIVESGVKYVKRNFLALRDFRGLEDVNRQAGEWVMGTAGNRVHGTTLERPLSRFSETEKAFLQTIPDVVPELVHWATARVHGDCHVQVEKCRYSVPFKFIRCEVWIRLSESVQVYHDQEMVAVHPRLARPGRRSTVRDHLPPEAQAYLMADPQYCLEQAEKIGENCRELVEELFSDRVLDRLRAAQGIIKLSKMYGKKRLEAACIRALGHGTVSYRNVKAILERGLDQEAVAGTELAPAYLGRAKYSSSQPCIQ